MSFFKWLSAFVGVAIAASVLATALFAISGGFSAPPCTEVTDVCLQMQDLANSRSQQIAAVIGISLSAIGTLALVVTIVLSARATQAAIVAADAANLAVAIARETSIRELRPYVSLTAHQMYWNSDNDIIHTWFVRIGWRNTGVSSALKVRALTNHIVVDGVDVRLPEQFDFPDRASDNTWIGSLGRDGSFYQGTAAIPVGDIQRIIDGEATLFVWSWVEYEGLESNQRYRTEFAASFFVYNGPATNREIGSNYTYIDRFNGVDHSAFRPPSPLTT